ncbi:TonB-dependent receptor [Sphingomonas canadensis]|uniref:TonB-dependent receptor n=1 Tax=Sphingomonas canadensis TaxID=1219257 RepID=A0ABW3H1A5_9SPHN|nr:TonB-dependent receptor [Sphingomonas canadensis]MCW3834854.1 TonB-dependent receptor [Sphingomonas canadensis]
MKLRIGCALSALAMGAMPAHAQEPPAPPQHPPAAPGGDPAGEDEILVTGELPGAIVSEIPPEQQLTPADIRSYGAGSLGELITALAPQTGSGRGRGGDGGPVVLLNGRRISSFSEIREIPPEAILRIDIFPEEVALKFGYRADQRVVNVVLRPRFRAFTAELAGGAPTAGGNWNRQASLNILRIGGPGRVSFDIGYSGNSGLLESERDVIPTRSTLFDTLGNVSAITTGGEIDPALSALAGQTVTVAGVPAGAAGGAPSLGSFVPGANQPNTSDSGAYRTLVAPSDALTLNGVVSRNLSDGMSATFNARLEVRQSEALLGRAGVALVLPDYSPFSPFGQDVLLSRYPAGLGALSRNSASQNAHLGFTVNGELSKWRWTVTGNFDRDRNRSVTTTGLDTAPLQALLDAGDPAFNPFGLLPAGAIAVKPSDRALSVSRVAALDLLVNGSPFRMPAGDASASVRVTGRTRDYDSEFLRAGAPGSSSNSRDEAAAQFNLDLPITSRREGVLSAIGNLSVNGSVEVERYSDFGTLVTRGYGAVWSPLSQVTFVASVTDEEGAPTAQQLGDPVVFTPNVRVFDYVRGESVDITSITGGNPGLGADSRHVLKLGLNARPFDNIDLNLRAEYVASTTRNQIAGFPSATAEVEAAFPARFVRDASGRLTSVDMRPVNFDRADRSELRWGFNFSMPLSSSIEKMVQRYRGEVEEAQRNGQPIPPPPEQLRMRWGRDGRPGQGGGPGGQGGPRGEAGAGGPPGGGFGGRGPGGGGGGRGFGGRGGGLGGPNGMLAGRLQFALYHTIHLKEQVVVSPGLPVLDLLDGSAIGSRGGQSRHELEAQAGLMKDGLALRLSAKWQSATHVDGGTAANPQPLRFSPLGTINLRLFADLGQQLNLSRNRPWMRGMRVTLSVDNLFDTRLKVTDANGLVPLSYQPDLLDPTGRTIKLTIRKLFF